jgi:hypothetical protein
MDRNIKLTNSDNGKTVEIPLNKLDDGLSSELKEVEERTGKTVTGISLEMEKIRAGKPHNLGFSFD